MTSYNSKESMEIIKGLLIDVDSNNNEIDRLRQLKEARDKENTLIKISSIANDENEETWVRLRAMTVLLENTN